MIPKGTQHFPSAPPPKERSAIWLILVLIGGIGAIGAALYFKTPMYKSEKKVSSVAQAVAHEVTSCTNEVEQLRKENAELKHQLEVAQAPAPAPAVAAPTKPKRLVPVPKEAKPQPSTPSANAKDSIPQSPWNSSRVPEPVVKWLQHD